MPFNASEADKEIVKLDYDFRPFVKAHGTTPEPTEEMILEFQEATRNHAKLLGREDDVNLNDPKSVLRFQRSLSKDDLLKISDLTLQAMAKLTQGCPSYEELKEFNQKKHRLCAVYMAQLMSDILNPKGVNIAMND